MYVKAVVELVYKGLINTVVYFFVLKITKEVITRSLLQRISAAELEMS